MSTIASNNPLISIVIPAYNAEKYIEAAIQSIQTQSFKNIEIIVIDDGSTDKTRSIVNRLKQSDSRIKLYPQKNSGKPAIARNKGSSKAIGKYIAFLDADDKMLPGKLEAQLNLYSDCDDAIDLIFHDCDHIAPDNTILQHAHLAKTNFLIQAYQSLTPHGGNTYTSNADFYIYASTHSIGILTSQVMIKRKIIIDDNLWFAEDLTIGEDIDLWLKIFMDHRIGYIDKVLTQYRKHPGSITQDPEGMIYGQILVRERNLQRGNKKLSQKDKRVIKHQIATKYRNLAYNHYIKDGSKNRLLARQYYIKSFFLLPSLKHLLSAIKTFLPFNQYH